MNNSLASRGETGYRKIAILNPDLALFPYDLPANH